MALCQEIVKNLMPGHTLYVKCKDASELVSSQQIAHMA